MAGGQKSVSMAAGAIACDNCSINSLGMWLGPGVSIVVVWPSIRPNFNSDEFHESVELTYTCCIVLFKLAVDPSLISDCEVK